MLEFFFVLVIHLTPNGATNEFIQVADRDACDATVTSVYRYVVDNPSDSKTADVIGVECVRLEVPVDGKH